LHDNAKPIEFLGPELHFGNPKAHEQGIIEEKQANQPTMLKQLRRGDWDATFVQVLCIGAGSEQSVLGCGSL